MVLMTVSHLWLEACRPIGAPASRKDKSMSSAVSQAVAVTSEVSTARASALADRLEQGARALATLARELTESEWQTRVPKDGRKIGVMIHHVASVYPLEIQLAQTLASGQPIEGVTSEMVDHMNADHARQHDAVTKDEAIDLLLRNSEVAAAVIRAFSARELDQAAPVSLYSDAPLTCQFVLEDHAVRHSYHHLARIRHALKR